uniref:Uncharacterized protein n=1 Tax=Arundo donax TaxID=35708 RepID=A0A0A9ABY3_ARUDO
MYSGSVLPTLGHYPKLRESGYKTSTGLGWIQHAVITVIVCVNLQDVEGFDAAYNLSYQLYTLYKFASRHWLRLQVCSTGAPQPVLPETMQLQGMQKNEGTSR